MVYLIGMALILGLVGAYIVFTKQKKPSNLPNDFTVSYPDLPEPIWVDERLHLFRDRLESLTLHHDKLEENFQNLISLTTEHFYLDEFSGISNVSGRGKLAMKFYRYVAENETDLPAEFIPAENSAEALWSLEIMAYYLICLSTDTRFKDSRWKTSEHTITKYLSRYLSISLVES